MFCFVSQPAPHACALHLKRYASLDPSWMFFVSSEWAAQTAVRRRGVCNWRNRRNDARIARNASMPYTERHKLRAPGLRRSGVQPQLQNGLRELTWSHHGNRARSRSWERDSIIQAHNTYTMPGWLILRHRRRSRTMEFTQLRFARCIGRPMSSPKSPHCVQSWGRAGVGAQRVVNTAGMAFPHLRLPRTIGLHMSSPKPHHWVQSCCDGMFALDSSIRRCHRRK